MRKLIESCADLVLLVLVVAAVIWAILVPAIYVWAIAVLVT